MSWPLFSPADEKLRTESAEGQPGRAFKAGATVAALENANKAANFWRWSGSACEVSGMDIVENSDEQQRQVIVRLRYSGARDEQ
jgi:hypothetical protein